MEVNDAFGPSEDQMIMTVFFTKESYISLDREQMWEN